VEKHKCENDHENNALLTWAQSAMTSRTANFDLHVQPCELRGSSPVEMSATRSASRRSAN